MLPSLTEVNSADRIAETSITSITLWQTRKIFPTGCCKPPWWQTLGGRHLGTVPMNNHSKENWAINVGFPKHLKITTRNPQGTAHNEPGCSRTFLSNVSLCMLAYSQSARMETGLLCRTQRILPIGWACTSESQQMHPGLQVSSSTRCQMPNLQVQPAR